MKKYFEYIISIVIVAVVLLLYITVCHAGDRKTTSVYDTGKRAESGNPIFENRTLLDPGECDLAGCVIYEHTTQGGLLYQWVDKDDDDVCDLIRVWKPIVDPVFGTF